MRLGDCLALLALVEEEIPAVLETKDLGRLLWRRKTTPLSFMQSFMDLISVVLLFSNPLVLVLVLHFRLLLSLVVVVSVSRVSALVVSTLLLFAFVLFEPSVDPFTFPSKSDQTRLRNARLRRDGRDTTEI